MKCEFIFLPLGEIAPVRFHVTSESIEEAWKIVDEKYPGGGYLFQEVARAETADELKADGDKVDLNASFEPAGTTSIIGGAIENVQGECF